MTETDIDAVLSDDRVDVVDICLPPALHVPVAVRVLRAGKHAICEKPLAASPEQARELAAIRAETGRSVFPVFQYRFGRSIYALLALREAGLLGEVQIGALETHWNRGPDYYQNPLARHLGA